MSPTLSLPLPLPSSVINSDLTDKNNDYTDTALAPIFDILLWFKLFVKHIFRSIGVYKGGFGPGQE
jgi:hypothetical protein